MGSRGVKAGNQERRGWKLQEKEWESRKMRVGTGQEGRRWKPAGKEVVSYLFPGHERGHLFERRYLSIRQGFIVLF